MTEASERLHACYRRIYEFVRAIPRGRVMTYGDIAMLIVDATRGPAPAITVGRAMAYSRYAAPDLPWWRVIGRSGRYGVLRSLPLSATQRDLLAQEGIHPDAEGRYDLDRYGYHPHAMGDEPA